jgi:hypothetical protein
MRKAANTKEVTHMVEKFWNLEEYYYGQITPILPPPPYGSVHIIDPIEVPTLG